ncbi:MAG: hypothetical protein J3K34DRAFT_445055 [Monoraphidium minutum]|nr:MAG: hypothetical protein J3K34DRAFT_445055 [Monoraphidium minutum]
MAGEASLLQLYRQILKAARDFPSVKKHSIIREIKAEFRANQRLTDSGKIAHCRELAERGLSDLQAYRAAAGGAGDANISLKGATH